MSRRLDRLREAGVHFLLGLAFVGVVIVMATDWGLRILGLAGPSLRKMVTPSRARSAGSNLRATRFRRERSTASWPSRRIRRSVRRSRHGSRWDTGRTREATMHPVGIGRAVVERPAGVRASGEERDSRSGESQVTGVQDGFVVIEPARGLRSGRIGGCLGLGTPVRHSRNSAGVMFPIAQR